MSFSGRNDSKLAEKTAKESLPDSTRVIIPQGTLTDPLASKASEKGVIVRYTPKAKKNFENASDHQIFIGLGWLAKEEDEVVLNLMLIPSFNREDGREMEDKFGNKYTVYKYLDRFDSTLRYCIYAPDVIGGINTGGVHDDASDLMEHTDEYKQTNASGGYWIGFALKKNNNKKLLEDFRGNSGRLNPHSFVVNVEFQLINSFFKGGDPETRKFIIKSKYFCVRRVLSQEIRNAILTASLRDLPAESNVERVVDLGEGTGFGKSDWESAAREAQEKWKGLKTNPVQKNVNLFETFSQGLEYDEEGIFAENFSELSTLKIISDMSPFVIKNLTESKEDRETALWKLWTMKNSKGKSVLDYLLLDYMNPKIIYDNKPLLIHMDERIKIPESMIMKYINEKIPDPQHVDKSNKQMMAYDYYRLSRSSLVTRYKDDTFFLAAEYGRAEAVEYLIDAKADFHEEYIGKTALILAIKNGHNNIVNILLDRNANPNQKNHGQTPLCIAIENGHLSIVNVLLTAKADPTQSNADGNTPLSLASKSHHSTLFTQALIEHKASPDAEAAEHASAAKIIEKYNLSLMNAENKQCIVNALLKGKAAVDQTNDLGQTPLIIAAAEKSGIDLVKALFEKKASVNIYNNKGDTPLTTASKKGNTESIKFLIEVKADISAMTKLNSDGLTPLHYAIRESHDDAVCYLIKAKVNFDDDIDKNKNSALLFAVDEERIKIVDALLAAKADLTRKNNIIIEETGEKESAFSIAKKRENAHIIKMLNDAKAHSNSIKISPTATLTPKSAGTQNETHMVTPVEEPKIELHDVSQWMLASNRKQAYIEFKDQKCFNAAIDALHSSQLTDELLKPDFQVCSNNQLPGSKFAIQIYIGSSRITSICESEKNTLTCTIKPFEPNPHHNARCVIS